MRIRLNGRGAKRPQGRATASSEGATAAALQTGNSNALRLLGYVSGSETHEKRLHQHFSQFRIQGEWFLGTFLSDVRGQPILDPLPTGRVIRGAVPHLIVVPGLPTLPPAKCQTLR